MNYSYLREAAGSILYCSGIAGSLFHTMRSLLAVIIASTCLCAGLLSPRSSMATPAREWQEPRYSLQFRDASLQEVFQRLERVASVAFFYSVSELDAQLRITVSFQQKTLPEMLRYLERYGYAFQLKGKVVAVRPLPKPVPAPTPMLHGRVLDESGMPLPGVYVGPQQGAAWAVTDMEGRFSIPAPEVGTVICTRSIGYQEHCEAWRGQLRLQWQLQQEVSQLQEVVVTAFGLQQDRKALGYSVQKVEGQEFAHTREVNALNALQGRVAGLQLSTAASGAMGSSRLLIRGNNSIGGNNEPLYVVDGVPIDNTPAHKGGERGGLDYGNPAAFLNPDDIESISVLKGGNAAALYGTRAANGVILITTKRAESGLGISLGSHTAVETPLLLPDYQQEFGRGAGGQLRLREGVISRDQLQSWGPRYDGRLYTDWDGRQKAYRPEPGNIADFFRTGWTLHNTLSITGGSRDTQLRFSVAQLQHRSMLPESGMGRTTLSLRGQTRLHQRLSLDTKMSYQYQWAENRPNLGGSPDNPMFALINLPRSVSLADLRSYKDAEGYPRLWDGRLVKAGESSFNQNPYWSVYENRNRDIRERLTGFAKLDVQLWEGISLMLRAGIDNYRDERMAKTVRYTAYKAIGGNDGSSLSTENSSLLELNTDFLLSGFRELGHGWKATLSAGGNVMFRKQSGVTVQGTGFKLPNLETTGNLLNSVLGDIFSEKEIQSLYAFGQLSYQNMVFLDVTGRNDWSSTLAPQNRSFFYPSVSGAWVLSDTWDWDPAGISLLKVRASWARVGNDTNPYQLEEVYASSGKHLDQPYTSYMPTRPNYDLKPELTTSREAGFAARFWNNRLGMSASYYHAGTYNQILRAPVDPATGYTHAWVNAGLIENKGVEFSLTARPWVLPEEQGLELRLNLSHNRSVVRELAPGVQTYTLNELGGLRVEARPGQPYGQLVGTAYVRDEQGRLVINPDSQLPMVQSGQQVLGNAMPKWLASLSGTFNYKGLQVSALLDARLGGQLYAHSEALASRNGSARWTLEGRDGWYASEADRIALGYPASQWNPTGGLWLEGVVGQKTEGAWRPTDQAFAAYVSPEAYWQHVAKDGGIIHEQFVYDASFVKLRELTVSYALPQRWLRGSFCRELTLALVGRNLAYLWRRTRNADPEAQFSVGNGQGIEMYGMPAARSFGLQLQARI